MSENGTARLLIVDDEEAQMAALRNTLQDHGYEVVGCTSAEEGLEALRSQPPFELLLADLMMPGMDGIALLKAALRIDPTLVGIIMTGAGTIGSAVQAMQTGALDYILKPFKLSAILPVLARALSMRHLRLENVALERRIRERSAELEAANTELDAFTRSASHDLRTPLNAVIGFADLLAMKYAGQLPEEAQGWLGQIGRAGRRMNQLIEDLLNLSRLGQQALTLGPVDMGALARGVADELVANHPERHLGMRLGTLPPALGDKSLLYQVFVNLLSNACKFTRRVEPAEIEIGTLEQDAELVYFVRDNGSGFDMAQADRLFGAFQRLHSASDFEGTGVGLSIVQRIVQRHGGRIWAASAPGQGATFFFTLAPARR